MEKRLLLIGSRRHNIRASRVQLVRWAVRPIRHGRSLRFCLAKAKRRRVPASPATAGSTAGSPESAKRTAALQKVPPARSSPRRIQLCGSWLQPRHKQSPSSHFLSRASFACLPQALRDVFVFFSPLVTSHSPLFSLTPFFPFFIFLPPAFFPCNPTTFVVA